MNKVLPELIDRLQQSEALLSSKKVTAGFDGFVDTIVRIIKEKKSGELPAFFNTIKQFGQYINEKEGGSFSLEVEEISSRLGGNMPIMANAMAHFGVQVNCVGALGYPTLHPVFAGLAKNCTVYSFADPGLSTAYEFNDGKILLGQNGELNTAGWEIISNRIGMDTLIDLYRNSDLLCIVNWSEIDASTDTWKGLLHDVLPNIGKRLPAFFDLSDCSKRSDEAIQEAMMLLQHFSKYCGVILGLNNNEAKLIYQSLFQEKPPQELLQIGERIYEKLGLKKLVLHSSRETVGLDKQGIRSVKTFFINKPVISTGAGDNFNAGFCSAQLMGLNMEQSLTLANTVAASYVGTGKHGSLQDCINFLQYAATNF